MLTLEELRNVTQDMLDSGVHPDTPVRLRTKRDPGDPNTDPLRCTAEDVWADSFGNVNIDQEGV